jgi:hypothetical protein
MLELPPKLSDVEKLVAESAQMRKVTKGDFPQLRAALVSRAADENVRGPAPASAVASARKSQQP